MNKAWYNKKIMKDRPLIETHPYLKDPVMRNKLIEKSVIASFGVEGIKIDPTELRRASFLKNKQKKSDSK